MFFPLYLVSLYAYIFWKVEPIFSLFQNLYCWNSVPFSIFSNFLMLGIPICCEDAAFFQQESEGIGDLQVSR